MLRDLRIQDFALIEQLHLAFGPRLNVLTGETGAGKSILIDAMTMLVGGRASPEYIRAGKEEAIIEAAFTVPETSQARVDLAGMGYVVEDDLVVQRVLTRSGKGRVYLNGRPITAGMLGQVASHLVDLHGQHEHQSLLRSDTPLTLLDAFADLDQLRGSYRTQWSEWQALRSTLADSESRAATRNRDLAHLAHEIDELSTAQVQPGEWETLGQERAMLGQAERLREVSHASYQRLDQNDDSLVAGVSELCANLDKLAATDGRLQSAADLGQAALIPLRELAGELRAYIDRLDHSQDRLDQVETRLEDLARLRRKYGVSPDDLPSLLATKQAAYDQLRSEADASETLSIHIDMARRRMVELAAELHDRRVTAAGKLETLVNTELGRLKMSARIDITLEAVSEDGWGPYGCDQVEFLIATNPGEPSKPLRKIASGGELSRLMLALKSVLAQVDQVPTLIFDEVDTGVGGAVAEVVGRRLQAIAAHRQVLCVTHLPQVASGAETHIVVEKSVHRDRTITRARQLAPAERTREVARMLAGEEITPTALRHAEEMIALVNKAGSRPRRNAERPTVG